MTRSLILGGAGFIGSNLVRAMISGEDRPRIFTRPSYALANIEDIQNRIEVIHGDFMDDVALRAAVQGVDIVYHLVSTTFPSMTIESSVYDVLSNLLPTIRLLEICASSGVRKVVYASSGGTVYGEPLTTPISEDHPRVPKSAYGQSKLTIENYLDFYARTSSLEIDILRLSNPYGPYQNPYGIQGIVAVAMGCARSGRPLKLFGRGETIRDYIYVRDAVSAMVLAGKKSGSHLANISASEGHSVLEIVAAVERISGVKIRKEFIPARKGDVSVNILSNRRAQEIYGWAPCVNLEDGLRQTWEWMTRAGRGTALTV
jgi:UDP-glucose 4-epimerase